MTRYCVEFLKDSHKYLLHQQHCITYPHVDLLSLPRVTDLGTFFDFTSASLTARQDYEAFPCAFCCAREEHVVFRPGQGATRMALRP